VPKAGKEPRLESLVNILVARGLAAQKFPEHLELVESLPRTASGKVKKFVLRQEIANKLRDRQQESADI
jgi:non-ribosomal peptide synthetase component E (peptide arylation enzyme)